jgi:mannose-6-phosphate isomerase-like protein (cupin superfamily)
MAGRAVRRWLERLPPRDEHGTVLVDSRTMGSRPAPGDAMWITPLVAHSVENVGDRDLHIIAVEVKAAREEPPKL